MSDITYLTGDATRPTANGPKVIVHICNDVGGWGKGFVVAISKRWSSPESEYRQWFAEREQNDFALGAVQFVNVEDSLWIGNMIAQHKIKADKSGDPPIRYDAVESCLAKVAEFSLNHGCSIHMPRIGCGLAGGRWEIIEPLIQRTCLSAGISVFVYDFM